MRPCALVCLQRCLRYLSTGNVDHQESARADGANRNNYESNRDNDYNQINSSSSSRYRQNNRRAYEKKRSNFHTNIDSSRELKDKFESLNHYQRLNVEVAADPSEIKSAYYSLSKIYHPDVVGSGASQVDNFRLITESYDLLSDPKRRAEYDRKMNLVPEINMTEFTSWSPSMQSSRVEQDNIMRSRAASDMIYKMRREAAILEQERRKNPKRYRAGSFTSSSTYEYNRTEELSKLDNRLKEIEKVRDSSESFYKGHMRDNILRRRLELQDASQKRDSAGASKSNQWDKFNKAGEPGDLVPFVITFGLFFSVAVGGLIWSLGGGFVVLLDDRLKAYRDQKQAEAERKKAISMSAINTT